MSNRNKKTGIPPYLFYAFYMRGGTDVSAITRGNQCQIELCERQEFRTCKWTILNLFSKLFSLQNACIVTLFQLFIEEIATLSIGPTAEHNARALFYASAFIIIIDLLSCITKKHCGITLRRKLERQSVLVEISTIFFTNPEQSFLQNFSFFKSEIFVLMYKFKKNTKSFLMTRPTFL